MRAFAPPALVPTPSTNLWDRFNALVSYYTTQFFPYLTTYFQEVSALDQIRTSITLTGARDGVNQQFTVDQGRIRFAPNGTIANPNISAAQAILFHQGAPLTYVATVGLLTPGAWTLLVNPDGTQVIHVGTAPGPADQFGVVMAVLV
jgi:hypothetical protein